MRSARSPGRARRASSGSASASPWNSEEGLALGEKIADHVFTTRLRTL
ncbi:hypothetical protein L1856_25865 [Streptomyces sp. Tue 6430]|nr:hypothetical protein [Streptomyces sp. Tue 6430]